MCCFPIMYPPTNCGSSSSMSLVLHVVFFLLQGSFFSIFHSHLLPSACSDGNCGFLQVESPVMAFCCGFVFCEVSWPELNNKLNTEDNFNWLWLITDATPHVRGVKAGRDAFSHVHQLSCTDLSINLSCLWWTSVTSCCQVVNCRRQCWNSC